MFDENADRILASLSPSDVVLDIGGWARPFNRANFVLDAEPYDTRGYYGAERPAQGGAREWFTRDTWIQRDICDHAPFPFRDKEIDYVICSHTLEDIRDPLWVCSEMQRVARRGYIEVPSRAAESARGTEPGQVGWSHHRWLIDVGPGRITFLMKYHMIHSHWRFSLPASYLRRLPERARVQWLEWEGEFEATERTFHGLDTIAEELDRFVRERHLYRGWARGADGVFRRASAAGGRVARAARRLTG